MTRLRQSSAGDSPDTIRLALGGDLMLGRGVALTIKEKGYDYPWGDILPALAGTDLFLVNLECALTSETRRWFGGAPKEFHFRADPDMVAVLTAGGVSWVSLANNHIGDFGEAGLLETVRVLDQAGIAHAGAGIDLAAARAPARFLARGRRVSVFAAADHPAAWRASDGGPGMHFLALPPVEEELAPFLDAIRAERSRAEHIILSLHWGPNMRERPSAEFRKFAHRMLSAGVDVVWGHSAHIPQGIELVQGKIIFYDSGDLVDDYAVDPVLRNDLGAVFLLTLGPAGVEALDVIPVQMADCQVRLARGDGAAWITSRIAALSAECQTILHPENAHLGMRLQGGAAR